MGGRLQALPLVGPLFYDITPQEVRAFWHYMQDKYHTTVIDKNDSTLMKTVATLLDAMKIVNKNNFMKNFTTTLGRRIYTPFAIGSPQGGWSLWEQVSICVHEHQHVIQYEKSGAAEFAWSYVTDHVARARYEAEAYTCTLEMNWWRYKKLLNVSALASLLSNYGCNAADIAVVTKRLGLVAASIRSGAVVEEATAAAVSWLNANVPRLHAI